MGIAAFPPHSTGGTHGRPALGKAIKDHNFWLGIKTLREGTSDEYI
jgi:hypothetical protein